MDERPVPRIATVALLLAALLVSAGIAEIGARTLLSDRLEQVPRHAESLFWEADDELGWSHVPSATGDFSDGVFRGHVHLAADGVRLNAATDTRVDGWANWLAIGDSTTASLEVDDDETFPARLETLLRGRGAHVNVVNLGVRGYSTGQAVGVALRYAHSHAVARILYLYADNDVYNNNTLKHPARVFGKPALIRSAPDGAFHWVRPDRDSDWADGSLIVLDARCAPFVHHSRADVRRSPFERVFSERGWARLKSDVYLARLAELVARQIAYRLLGDLAFAPPGEELDREPYELIAEQRGRWSEAFEAAYWDGGVLRERCHAYFTDQMAAHLERLRAIEGLERVDVFEFPSPSTVRVSADTPLDEIPTMRMFRDLGRRGLVDSFTSITAVLREEGRKLSELSCASDPHFCAAGNRWLAEQIAQRLGLPEHG